MKRTLIALAVLLMALCACNRSAQELPDVLEEPVEERLEQPVSGEPYGSLYAEGYQEQSVVEFDQAFFPYQDLYSGYSPKDPDVAFMRSLFYAKLELLGQELEETPCLNIATGYGNWLLSYEIEWTIGEKDSVTVGQRDNVLQGCQDLVRQAFEAVNEKEWEGPRAITDLQVAFDQIAKEQSLDWVDIEIQVESIEYYGEG